MAAGYHDRVKETTITTGTGNITLAGAVTQFRSFASLFPTDQQFYYAIVGQTGVEWEVGIGHLSTLTVLVRDRVIESSNGDAVVNFSAGAKDVFNTIAAEAANQWVDNGEGIALANCAAMP